MKVGSQEIPRVTGKFGLGVQNEAGQRPIELSQENTLVITNTLSTTQEMTVHMDSTRWSILKSEVNILFAAEDGEALYSQQKQDWELTVAQTMSSLLQNLGLKLNKVNPKGLF